MKRLLKWVGRVWHSPAVTLVRRGAEAAAKQRIIDVAERALEHSFGDLLRMNDTEAAYEKVSIDLCEAQMLLEEGKVDSYQARIKRLANALDRARL